MIKNKVIIIALSVLIVVVAAVLIITGIAKSDNDNKPVGSTNSSAQQGVDEIVIGGESQSKIEIDFDTGSIISSTEASSSDKNDKTSSNVVVDEVGNSSNVSGNSSSQTSDNSGSSDSDVSLDNSSTDSSSNVSSLAPDQDVMPGNQTPWRE